MQFRIEQHTTLSENQQRKVEHLIKVCNAYDQSEVPMQFDHSLNYFPEMNSWFLCYEEDTLIGMLSIFNPLSDVAELSGCIQPNKRGAGRFNELMAVAKQQLGLYSIQKVLFVLDNASQPGRGAIANQGLKCDHIEYLMKYEHFKKVYDTTITVREADMNDMEDFVKINSQLFHETREESQNIFIASLQSEDRKQYMAEVGGEVIGICTLFFCGSRITIYGLGIAEAHQGKRYGLGLVNSILDLLKDTHCELELEVDSTNERAYNLYTKVGFREARVVNYYEAKL